jgi:putative restriction endonuclease
LDETAKYAENTKRFPSERFNPQNGLCLSKLHDAAFDDGLITLNEDLGVVFE